jgi:carboxypeptidase PM20D1
MQAGFGSAVLIVLLGVVLMINAFRQPSRQLSVTPAESIDIDVDAVAEVLAEFLSVPSYSYDDRARMDRSQFRRLHEILEQRFPEAHRRLHVETINEMSLLYQWEGRDASRRPILLMSHLDVVPVERASRNKWVHPYDSGTIADGFAWGRGALDDKCGVIGIMAAVEHLVARGFIPERTVYFAFGHDEEVGGDDGNGAIAQHFAEHGVRFDFVHDEGGAILNGVIPGVPQPVAFIAIAEKTTAHLTLTARGEGGHVAMSGHSAILNLAEAIGRIEDHPLPIRMTGATESLLDFLGPEMPWPQRVVMGNRWLFGGLIGSRLARSPSTNAVVRSTLNITQLRTESAPNQNDTNAHAMLNARLLPGDTAEQVRDHVRSLVEDLVLCNGTPAIECQVMRSSAGEHVSPIDCAEFHALQRTIHEVFPDVVVAAGLTSVSTDASWYYGVTDKIYRFIPMRLKPDDVTRIHGINERIGIENMAEIVRFYVQLIRNSGQ